MNEWQGRQTRSSLARLGLILVLVSIALWTWPMAEAHLSAQQTSNSEVPFAVTQPALSATKTVTPVVDVAYHSAVTYAVVLGNAGIISDTAVFLTDTLPVEVAFARWAAGGQPVGAQVVAGELTWQGTVTAGQALTFTFVVSHVGHYGDVVANTATFSGTQQAGGDTATFTVTGKVTHTVHLPLVIKNQTIFSPFAMTYDNAFIEYGSAIQQTDDGGYIVAGRTDSVAGSNYAYDAWVLKLNADGSVAWQKTYGGTGGDEASDIQQTSDGGYVVVGQTNSFGAGDWDFWVLKLNAEGSLVWQKTYGGAHGDYAPAVRQTGDGGYVVAGSTVSWGSGGYDAWVLKLDAAGSATWQKIYGGADDYYANAIRPAGDGGYVVAGSTEPLEDGDRDVWVLKLNADGSIAWQKTYGGPDDDFAGAIQPTDDGGYIVAGGMRLFAGIGPDAWVLKLNGDGSVAWQKTYGGAEWDYVHTIQLVGDGGCVVAGMTESFGAGGRDAWVLKLNADGNIAWQKTYGGPDWDDVSTIQQTGRGYVAAGITESFGVSGYDAWVLKLDANGSFCAGCSLGQASTATAADSGVTPADGNATAVDSDATVNDSNAAVNDTLTVPEPICVCAPTACR